MNIRADMNQVTRIFIVGLSPLQSPTPANSFRDMVRDDLLFSESPFLPRQFHLFAENDLVPAKAMVLNFLALGNDQGLRRGAYPQSNFWVIPYIGKSAQGI